MQLFIGFASCYALATHWSRFSPVQAVYLFLTLIAPAVILHFASGLVIGVVTFLFQGLINSASSLLQHSGMSFRGQHVVITGGSAGLGRSLALFLARDYDAHVTILARNAQIGELAASEITNECRLKKFCHGKCQFFSCDVTDFEALTATVRKATDNYGGLAPSVLISNAGAAAQGLLQDLTPKTFRAQMELNYMGAVNSIYAVLPSMLTSSTKRCNKKGTIVVVSSALSLMGCPGCSQYCASKFALRGLVESLRMELVGTKIKLFHFCPSNIDTPGYATECKTKVPVTRMIDEATPTCSADDTARACLQGMAAGEFNIVNTTDLELVMASSLGSSISRWPVRDYLLFPIWWLGVGAQRIIWDLQIARLFNRKPKGSE